MHSTLPRTLRLSMMFLMCGVLLSACSEPTEMGPKEKQAIQMVKAYTGNTDSFDSFSIISNIEKRAQDSGRAGNKWEMGEWRAGLPSQKDRIIETLSQYFNIFRPEGNYWVRFPYKDNDGDHEALWDVNVYTKKIEAKNDLAKSFESES